MTARGAWGQLTYTWFELPGTRGGWQVKDQRDVSEEDAAALQAGLTPEFQPVEELPAFPTPEQAQAAPKRLVHLPGPQGSSLLWHTALAGADASGRPGNVFIHGAIERKPASAHLASYPAEYAASASWLTPFGPDAVSAATIDGGQIDVGAEVSRASVVDFLFDAESPGRLGVLSALIGGVDRSMADGTTLLLAAPDWRDAAFWVGAVGYFASPGSANRIGFSTYERVTNERELDQVQRRGLHLCVIPMADLDPALRAAKSAASGGRPIPAILDASADMFPADLGDPPIESLSGVSIPVTPWQALVTASTLSPASLAEIYDLISSISNRLADGGDLALGWPIAMASTFLDTMPGSGPAAVSVVAREAPPDLGDDLDLQSRAMELVAAELGGKAAEVRDYLDAVCAGRSFGGPSADAGRTAHTWPPRQRRLETPGVIDRLVLSAYLTRALTEPDYLLSLHDLALPGGITMDPGFERGAELWESARTACADLADVERAACAARALDLLVRAGVRPPAGAAEWVANALAAAGVWSPRPEQVANAAQLSATGLALDPATIDLLRPAIALRMAECTEPWGERLPAASREWLHPRWNPAMADALDVELGVLTYLAGPEDPAARSTVLAAMVAVSGLADGAWPQGAPPELTAPIVASLASLRRATPWRAHDALGTIGVLPLDDPHYAGLVFEAMVTEPPGEMLRQLCGIVAPEGSVLYQHYEPGNYILDSALARRGGAEFVATLPLVDASRTAPFVQAANAVALLLEEWDDVVRETWFARVGPQAFSAAAVAIMGDPVGAAPWVMAARHLLGSIAVRPELVVQAGQLLRRFDESAQFDVCVVAFLANPHAALFGAGRDYASANVSAPDGARLLDRAAAAILAPLDRAAVKSYRSAIRARADELAGFVRGDDGAKDRDAEFDAWWKSVLPEGNSVVGAVLKRVGRNDHGARDKG